MKRVLVTGASGFVGRNCIAPLLRAGYEVCAADINVAEKTDPAVRWIKVDLFDEKEVGRIIGDLQPTHLLHFAWYAELGKYWTSPENLRWVKASLNLFEKFYANGGRRLVAAGTCAEYDWKYGFCSENVTPLAPATLYGACKHALRVVLDAFSEQNRLNSAWGRIFFLYGPHEHPGRLVASVIESLLGNRPALCSHGNQIRDFLHVVDAASAFTALLESDVRGAVNIASGEPVTIKEVVLKIARHLGREELVELGALPSRENDPPVLTADVSRLRNEVLWTPGIGLDAGITDTIGQALKTRQKK